MPYIGQGLTEGRRRAYNFVATSNQTTFTATYDVGYVDVYQNGILLTTSDYTATNGTTVVLGVGASASDEITIIAHQIFSVSDTVSAGQGGSFGGAIDVTGNITTTGSLRGPSSFTIDPATHGDNTGTVVIAGDLTVNGTTTTINSTTLTVDDKNLILASGTSNSSTADGSGLTIDLGSDGTATMVYTHATTSIDFNKDIKSPGATFTDDVTFTGDNYNAVWDKSANALEFADNAEARFGTGEDLRIFHDGTNNIIRGMTSPTWIQTDNTIFLTKNAASETMAKFIGDGAVELYHNNVKKIETTSTGVTVSSSADVTINITAGGTSNDSLINFVHGSTTDGGITYDHNGAYASEKMVFRTGNNTPHMYLDGNGNLGIGQSNPSYKFEVSGTGDIVQYIANANPNGTQGRTLVIRDNYASASQDSKISFAATSSPGNDVYLGKRTTSNAGYFHLTNSGGAEHLTVDMASGAVGIGTTSPTALLQITPPNEHQNSFRIYRGGSSGYQLNYLNMSLYQGNTVFNTTSTDSSGKRYLFQINGTEKFRIDQDGDVGIGTTNPYKKLTLSASFGGSALDLLDLQSSASGGGTAPKIRFGTFAANSNTIGRIGFVDEPNYGGEFVVETNSSGGATDTTTEKFRIDKDGNVGIGTNNPQKNLHIYQSAGSGNNYDQGTIQLGGTSGTLGLGISYNALGSGRANISGLNTSGGTNNRLSLGFGAIQSYGEPADRVLTIDQGHYVHHTPPGNSRFMPMISPQSVTRHGAYPTHPAGDAVGTNQTNSTQLGFAHVYARNWSGGRYLHMKTNIPCSNSNYGMVIVYAKGYRYSPGGTIDSSWGFHNWGGAIYSLDQRNYATTFAVNCYDSSDNYCVLVGDNQTTSTGSYTGFRLDFMYSNTNYGAHTETANGESHYLLATSFSSSTSGVY